MSRDRMDCLTLATAMPDYFTVKGLVDMERDLRDCPFYVSVSGRELEGFAVVRLDPDSRVTDIRWMAVRADKQRSGIGTALIDRILRDSRSHGILLLRVETLSPLSSYSPYEKTRRFYEKVGFKQVRNMDYPNWDPGNPCAVYEKAVASAGWSDTTRAV